MNDIENAVYTAIRNTILETYDNAYINGQYVRVPPSFPAITIEEQDNYTSAEDLSTSDKEDFSTVMYEVNVYSNKGNTAKTEAKAIANIIDEKMYSMNFTRISRVPVPNLENSSIYRITIRYRAKTNGKNIYRI